MEDPTSSIQDSSARLQPDLIAGWSYVDPSPFEIRARRWKSVGFWGITVYLLCAAYLVVMTSMDAPSILRFLAISLLVVALWTVKDQRQDVFESKVHSAKVLNQFKAAFDSDKKYILMLRSFTSELLSERTYGLRDVEREEMRMIRGERIPTGRKYKETVREDQRVDDVRTFLLAAAKDLPIVHIDRDERSMSSDMLCLLSSDKWWQIFEQLRDGAQLIAIMPEFTRSLKEEIETLADTSHLNKCVFIMPPSSSPGLARFGMTRRKRWGELRERLPMRLPEYSEEGALLMFATSGDLSLQLRYKDVDLARVLEVHSQDGIPLGQALSALYSKDLLPETLRVLQRESVSFVS